MEIILDKPGFSHYTNDLLCKAHNASEDIQNDLHYYCFAIIRYYNQIEDWKNNPNLAKKNYHHTKDDLQRTVVGLLINLNVSARDIDPSFNASPFLKTDKDTP
jgi:hypothetical protein